MKFWHDTEHLESLRENARRAEDGLFRASGGRWSFSTSSCPGRARPLLRRYDLGLLDALRRGRLLRADQVQQRDRASVSEQGRGLLWIAGSIRRCSFSWGRCSCRLSRGRRRRASSSSSRSCAIVAVAMAKYGTYGAYNFIGVQGLFGRVDKLSMVFAWVFIIMAFLGRPLRPPRRGGRPPHRRVLLRGGFARGDLRRRLPDPLHLLGDHGLLVGLPRSGTGRRKSRSRPGSATSCSTSSAGSCSSPG